MKTAFFTQNIKKGGTDTFILNLLANWPEDDQVILFCNRSHPGLDNLRKGLSGRAEVVAYDFWIAQDISARLSSWPRLARTLFRALFWLFGFLYLIWQSRALFKRYNPERLMVINGGYPGGDACMAATVAWAQFKPGVPAWHNFHNLVLPYSTQPVRRWKERLVDYFVARASAGFVTVSNASMATLSKRPRLNAQNKLFIHNGIAPIFPAPGKLLTEELGLPADSRVVLMLAVYEPRKGHAFIIDVMNEVVRRVPQACLLICGDGTTQEMDVVARLREQSSAAAHIVLQGHRADIANLLSQAELLVLPSQGQESFGYTVVEAMALSCPVVVSDVGGLPEVVADGVCGYVVPHDDRQLFADRIVALLMDESLRQRMGDAGRHRYGDMFCAKNMSNRYFQLLREGRSGDV